MFHSSILFYPLSTEFNWNVCTEKWNSFWLKVSFCSHYVILIAIVLFDVHKKDEVSRKKYIYDEEMRSGSDGVNEIAMLRGRGSVVR